jgi:hypothetical protein
MSSSYGTLRSTDEDFVTVLPSPAGRRGTRLAILVVAMVLTGPGPSREAPPAPADPPVAVAAIDLPWATQATARIDAELAAAHQSVADLVALYAPDVEIDRRPWTGRVLQGRDALLGDLRAAFGPAIDELEHHGLAVDLHGAAVQQHVRVHPRFTGPAELLDVRDYGPHGMSRSRVLVGAATLRRSPVAASDEAFAPLERLVERYLAVWSGAVRDGWRDLYAADAVVRDGAGGLTLRGVDALAEHERTWESSDAAVYALTTFPGTADPALYLDHPVPAAVGTLGLVIAPEDPAACPGQMTVVVELVDGRIASERRLRDIADVRRCETTPPAGWWQRLVDGPPPAGRAITRLPNGTEVVGAAPPMVGLVRWALGRFDRAGLPLEVASVTFANGTAGCDGIAGTVTDGEHGMDVLLCFDEGEVCKDPGCGTYTFAARATVLHELAHVWEASELHDADRERYLARTGLATWFGAEVGWSARGGERAAEVLMWGLLDQVVPVPRLGDPPAEQLASEFRLLTGIDPLREVSAG